MGEAGGAHLTALVGTRPYLACRSVGMWRCHTHGPGVGVSEQPTPPFGTSASCALWNVSTSKIGWQADVMTLNEDATAESAHTCQNDSL